MKKIIMIIMVVALVALPAMAQEWQSTSAMQGSGSAYSAQVTAVGASEVTYMATTTTSTPNNGPRRAKKGDDDPLEGFNTATETGQSGESPIGDAVLPLLLLACAYLGMRVFLKRKRALKS